ncbi:MAG: lytic transglycosylase [Coxiella sp. RIFCSPHIGHO2_12_FULL_44_14]|nr:MAG: lytic transglycosylase [Coxiella sp. RIFCSPHIGHO2_12_FULL_44_14]
MKRKIILLTFGLIISGFFILSSLSPTANAAQSMPWNEWVQQLRAEAIAQGIRPEIFDDAFANIKAPSRRVLHFERTQPEKRIAFLKYRSTRADPFRIQLGRKEYERYHKLLNEVGFQFKVNPCFIVSIWGLETSYGRYMGDFPVIQSLATLAYESPRRVFFHKQLLYALQILNEGHVDLQHFKGEWAGASGQPQFLPSSWHHYAIDYDHDGKKDIWETKADVFASIANYLLQHGWRADQPWAIEVTLPHSLSEEQWVNVDVTQSLGEWRRLGLNTIDGRPWPSDERLQAALIRPYGGPDLLIFPNFKVIMKWNRSTYYAGTVGWMAEQICARPLQ